MLRSLCVLSVLLVLPTSAFAFCGFYVGGADTSLYNEATMVVMMREGTTTVLSMQNDYSGPPEGFALIVPVPEVLEEGNVRTLPHEIFERVDRLAAPRLVEYWEQDPCYVPRPRRMRSRSRRMSMSSSRRAEQMPMADLGVTVEAEFAVGEYDIVILSAQDSGGLETWLRREQYAIPAGARQVLSPYVQLGTKFFVAKVDPERVTFQDGRVVLSPLRVHYDTDEFSLPVRLGLLNSRGQQDLIVHVLAKQQRYEVANYPNVMLPTNITVDDEIRRSFGAFYGSLFNRVVADNPGAVVTEYSWRATSCDPCPTTPLQAQELALLGADVIDGSEAPPDAPGKPARRVARPTFFGQGGPYTLTRLHYRYGPNDLQRDLVFRAAPAVIGGRGMPNPEGELQEKHAAEASGVNNFQGRYVILHRWEGEISCPNPTRGRWGGPPTPSTPSGPVAAPSALRTQPADHVIINLDESVLESDRQFLAVRASAAADTSLGVLPEPEPQQELYAQNEYREVSEEGSAVATSPRGGGCASCSASAGGAGTAIGFLLLMTVWLRRR